ncbi:MAG: hypothetical protein JST20_13160 [Bacteroidetes bacterium]|nr:hypothetical protein [Bacteroidota bacterium]
MKSLFLFIMCLITILGSNSCSENSISTKPVVLQKGDGILSGRCLLYTYHRDSSWHKDQLSPSNNASNCAGTLVKLLGTQISAITDSTGRWILRGIESGTYSIQFTHSGFDSITVNSLVHNGRDSVSLVWTDVNPFGQTWEYETVCLAEPPALVSVIDADVSALQRLTPYPIGGNYDTSYNWQSQFTIEVKAPISTVQSMLSVGYVAIISTHTPLDISELPKNGTIVQPWQGNPNGFIAYTPNNDKMVFPNGDKTKRYFEISGGTITNSQISVNIAEYAAKFGISLSDKPQLYLHIIPMRLGFTREWRDRPEGYSGGPYGTPQIDWVVGNPQSFPIAWQ